jgi:CO/xanthine dehydrogenase Mo-binding subunit
VTGVQTCALPIYAVHLARIEVDELTGRVTVADYLTVNDCGRIVNPVLFEGQQEGAVVQGLGYALSEDLISREGRMQATDLATYIVPTAADVPAMETIAIPIADSEGPCGLKGAGEIGIDAPAAAIANAINDACGIRLFRFPLTAERILAALIKDGDV